jgi:uncharacterized protein
VILSTLRHDGLDWDEGNRSKIEARVPAEVIEEFFKQELLIKEDIRNSFNEVRFLAIGYTKQPPRCLFVAFTLRTKDHETLIRPISARYTHKKEAEKYEVEVKKIKKNK